MYIAPRSRTYTTKHTLRQIGYAQPYGIRTQQFSTDYWQRKTLKTFDSAAYLSACGETRAGKGVAGLYEQLEKYDRPIIDYGKLPPRTQVSLTAALARTRDAFRLPEKVHPLDWEDVSRHMVLDTSAGWSFPGKTKGQILEPLYTEGRWLAHRMKQGGKKWDPRSVQMPPCMMARRGSLAPVEQPKDRLVWVYPAEMLMVEGLYAPKLIEAYKALGENNPMVQGRHTDRRIVGWLQRAKRWKVGMDVSAFDQSVQPWFIDRAFEILHDNIIWEHWKGQPVSEAQRRRWANLWQTMVWYFKNTPIVSPDGRVFRKALGVPSGSWFTQLVDSIVNYLYIQFLGLYLGTSIEDARVLGDDSAFSVEFEFPLDEAIDVMKTHFGVEIKKENCIQTEDPREFEFLGFTYPQYGRVRSFREWASGLMNPDGDVLSVEDSFSRLVGMFLAGGCKDKRFCEYLQHFQSCWDIGQKLTMNRSMSRYFRHVLGMSAQDLSKGVGVLAWECILHV